MTLGERIKRARERLRPRMTQKQLAEIFDISDKAISAWERDAAVPEPERLPALRQILRVTYAYLLEGVGEPPEPHADAVQSDDARSQNYSLMAQARKTRSIARAS